MSSDSEYASLREEIREISGRQVSLLTFSTTASVALITFAIDGGSQRALIALMPLIILWAVGLQMITYAYATMRIATYIAHYLENIDKKWETRMRELRKIESYKGRRSFPYFEIIPTMIGAASILISVTLALGINTIEKRNLTLTVCLLAGVFWLIFSWYFHIRMDKAVKGDLDDYFHGIWDTIQ